MTGGGSKSLASISRWIYIWREMKWPTERHVSSKWQSQGKIWVIRLTTQCSKHTLRQPPMGHALIQSPPHTVLSRLISLEYSKGDGMTPPWLWQRWLDVTLVWHTLVWFHFCYVRLCNWREAFLLFWRNKLPCCKPLIWRFTWQGSAGSLWDLRVASGQQLPKCWGPHMNPASNLNEHRSRSFPIWAPRWEHSPVASHNEAL